MNNTERALVVKSSHDARKSLAYKAIENGHQKNAKDFFKDGKLINSPDDDGKTLLHHSILDGKPDITIGLIGLNANPNLEDRNGHTPLLCALNGNKSEQVDFLRKHNAVIRTANSKGVIKNYRMITCSSSESEVPHEYHASEPSNLSTAASLSQLPEQPSETTSIDTFATEDKLPANDQNECIPLLSLNAINPPWDHANNPSHNQPSQLCQALTTFREFHTTTLTVDGNHLASLCLPEKGEVDDLPSADCTLMHDNHVTVPMSETLPENTENATPLDSDPIDDSEQLASHENLNTVVTSGMASFNAENVDLENPCPTAVKWRSGCTPSFFNCFKRKSQ